MEKEKQDICSKDVKYLTEVFNKVKEDYAKYLKVFMLFDPNSLGTISEVLLTKLLSKEGIEAHHTGGSQGLTDIIVNGHHISLKTTSGDTKIGLGSEKGVVDSRAVEIANFFKSNPELLKYSVEELADNEKVSEYYPDIIARIEAVAKKLAGDSNNEFFTWIEKTVNKKTGLLTSIKIHVVKYDYGRVLQSFKQGRVLPTRRDGSKSGWSLVDIQEAPIIVADIKSKYLNISPDFIRKSTEDRAIPVEFPTVEQNKLELGETVSNMLFESLDNIYRSIYGEV